MSGCLTQRWWSGHRGEMRPICQHQPTQVSNWNMSASAINTSWQLKYICQHQPTWVSNWMNHHIYFQRLSPWGTMGLNNDLFKRCNSFGFSTGATKKGDLAYLANKILIFWPFWPLENMKPINTGWMTSLITTGDNPYGSNSTRLGPPLTVLFKLLRRFLSFISSPGDGHRPLLTRRQVNSNWNHSAASPPPSPRPLHFVQISV